MTMGRTINNSKAVHKSNDVRIKSQGHQSDLKYTIYERTREKFQYVKQSIKGLKKRLKSNC